MTILKAYEAWGEKKNPGGEPNTAGNKSNGVRKVDTKNHTAQIL